MGKMRKNIKKAEARKPFLDILKMSKSEKGRRTFAKKHDF